MGKDDDPYRWPGKKEVGSSVCKYANGDSNGPLILTWERKQKYLLEKEREKCKPNWSLSNRSMNRKNIVCG